ncbi:MULTISPECIES: phosphoenolpyruvate synthase [Nitrosomonas]|uniref:Phosphoenolpyruvate synthase n=1 Tax=Nitrosomonas europaea (strain ATCC 19718 / CIP 103999 / KCTC 2705 / NBRC 14298) TaxID=228410 RepID=Q81ZR7_NITEU|nr:MULTISPECIES: phosphoenolpyruvate synthase [Nitrosomonas]CAD86271.1 ppsA; phosphoenolpyruvate synthase [Nitrosomonas europaea ATCC 19718]CAD86278.1 ppsA; phosphoenolpyruvate synthase [Nitrosomonas europaea ATCC 19718]SDW23238.1 phosphoenolpyruvate synthase [Nitrosomonas europaea]SES83690.1 phosphoenolpyruvate synthase [Nitrosomonas europaea]SKA06020.1 phosphoenolpyruvate synthase [Nitrosomonas europaea]
MTDHPDYILWLNQVGMNDIASVGGKNASLGEMIGNLARAGVKVPGGFATTTRAYREFLEIDGLGDRISQKLSGLDVGDVTALADTGKSIRSWLLAAPLPDNLLKAVAGAYQKLVSDMGEEVSFAVRSSATAEDLADASFAGQQETLLNVHGLENLISAIREVFASLYNDRAIAYRVHHGFHHDQVFLSAGVQKMVRSDRGASGVMFTLDTESGFREVVFVTSTYGLGETVVQGIVNPDEFIVYKPNLEARLPAILSRRSGTKAIEMIYSDGQTGQATEIRPVPPDRSQRFSLSDEQIESLARQAVIIERHYNRPMDIEWALDGIDGQIYIVQARPETVKSRAEQSIEQFRLDERGQVLVQGRAIGQKIGQGRARVILNAGQMSEVQPGDVLVTDMTDPDWEPIMKRAAAIVTNRGGRTCHAAIIARELGIPAVVGCEQATAKISNGHAVTVSCAEGDTGFVYEGLLPFQRMSSEIGTLSELPVRMMLNIGNPAQAFAFSRLPNQGVGLARLEFIINNAIGIHPRALLEFDTLPDDLQASIRKRMAGYPDPVSFYVEKLVEGIATLAAAFHPHPVIVRLSDFKSNEYANLIAGDRFEPHEENPMIGFRGASRYLADSFRACFELECRALRKVRDDMGFANVEVMVPFCRTLEEAQQITELLAANGLKRGSNGLRLIMMCEIPSNAVLAEEFLEYFDGFSIGSNDMTQLTLGLDRDSGLVAHLFDERNPAVKRLLKMAIDACHRQGKYIGICGQAPSDYPDFARWLVEQRISSLSLNQDTVVDTWLYLAGEKQ